MGALRGRWDGDLVIAALVLRVAVALHGSPVLAVLEEDPSDDAFLGEHDGPAPWWVEFGEIGHADPDAPPPTPRAKLAPNFPPVAARRAPPAHVPEVCEDDGGEQCTDGQDESGDDCECD